jgi:hypothetical protein
MYPTQGEHANLSTTDAVCYVYDTINFVSNLHILSPLIEELVIMKQGLNYDDITNCHGV